MWNCLTISQVKCYFKNVFKFKDFDHRRLSEAFMIGSAIGAGNAKGEAGVKYLEQFDVFKVKVSAKQTLLDMKSDGLPIEEN